MPPESSARVKGLGGSLVSVLVHFTSQPQALAPARSRRLHGSFSRPRSASGDTGVSRRSFLTGSLRGTGPGDQRRYHTSPQSESHATRTLYTRAQRSRLGTPKLYARTPSSEALIVLDASSSAPPTNSRNSSKSISPEASASAIAKDLPICLRLSLRFIEARPRRSSACEMASGSGLGLGLGSKAAVRARAPPARWRQDQG